MSNIIQSLWIGGEFSPMEYLSAKSFIDNGHEYHLYTYGDVKNVPEGVVVKDGREILPEEDIFAYKVGPGKGSFSAFSNYFRYKMLELKGGWWVDTDMICLRYWDFKEDYVFISEEEYQTGNSVVNSGAIKCPPFSEIMGECYDFCLQQDKDTLEWGVVGPRLLGSMVKKCNLTKYVQERQVFCPIAPFNAKMFVNPISISLDDFPSEIYGLHLWNEVFRRFNIDKWAKHSENCIYEQLMKRHNVRKYYG